MSLLSELFSDIFARQDNPLSRLDPRTKLIVAAAMLLFVIFSTSPALPLVVMIGCLAATIAVRVPARLVAMRLTAPLGIASVLFVLQAVMTGSTAVWSAHVFGWRIAVSHEGLHTGFQMAARVLGAVSVMQLLSSVTPAHRLFHAMRALGAPRGWVEVALLMYRYIFTLLDLTSDLTAAQRLRLGYSSVRRGLSAAGVVAGTVILRSVDQAGRTDEAMRVRGYRGDIPLAPLPPLAKRDWGIMTMAVCVLSGLFWAAGKR
ncbi:MAG: cobalt ECF transporter T component CbiQ [Verrucomicrobiota bacterium]